MLQEKHWYSEKLLADDALKKEGKSSVHFICIALDLVLPGFLVYLRTPSVSALGTEILFKGLCN